MSNDTYITIRGWVGVDPMVYTNDETGNSTTTFRVGTTPRSFDRRVNAFVDGETAWYTVRCYGTLGANVAESVHRGTPVVVRGKLVVQSYTTKDDIYRINHTIIADAVGIDLTSGTARFVKRMTSAPEPIPGEPGGAPVDPVTGEVLESEGVAAGESGDQDAADAPSPAGVLDNVDSVTAGV